MASKLIGLGMIIVGGAGVLLSYKGVQDFLKVSLSSSLANYLLIGGAVVLVLGAVIAFGRTGMGGGKQQEEVPIYEGEGKKRRIVGYRKMK